MEVFGERAPREEAESFARRRVNAQCVHIREGADWRNRTVLCPAVIPAHHGGYGRRGWAVHLDTPEGRLLGLVVHNFERTQLQFRKPFGPWKTYVLDSGETP